MNISRLFEKEKRKRLILPAVVAALGIVPAIFAMQSGTKFPPNQPQIRVWADGFLDFIGKNKEVIAILVPILLAVLAYIRITGTIASKIYTIAAAAAVPALAFVFTEAFYRGVWHVGASLSYEIAEPFSSMCVLNLLLYALFYLFCAFLTGSFCIGYTIASVFLLFTAIINFYVVQFRGTPIVPWDLLSIRTAGNVAGNYDFKIHWQLLFALFGFLFLLVLTLKMKGKIRRLTIRIPLLLAAAAAFVFLVSGIQKPSGKEFWGIDTTLFTPNVRYAKNGFWPAFLSNLSFLSLDKPEGYSVEKVNEIADNAVEAAKERHLEQFGKIAEGDTKDTVHPKQTGSTSADGNSEKYPNIIVIMDEAFSDLSVLGDFNTSEDYLPNFRKLSESYTSGNLLVSVKGGNTANTEYEFLSGDTTAFLPEGSVVFQQYIGSSIPTIAGYLKNFGYETIGMHPYKGSGWERDRVYPLMGFDRFLDLSAFSGADKLRSYVSDKGAFDKVIKTFEEKPAGSRQFIFLVTMQNHGGYTPKSSDNGFKEEIYLTDVGMKTADVTAAERYLTLIRHTDEALGELIDYFEKSDEPTVIVFFGDHQPGDYITQVIDRLTGGTGFTTASDNSAAAEDGEQSLEEIRMHYQVPFLIWNNFGKQKDNSVSLLSANYLAALTLKEAGIPNSAYGLFLNEMQTQIPAIAAGLWIDQNGASHSWSGRKVNSAESSDSEWLNNYQILEYNHLIDVKKRVESVFSEEAK